MKKDHKETQLTHKKKKKNTSNHKKVRKMSKKGPPGGWRGKGVKRGGSEGVPQKRDFLQFLIKFYIFFIKFIQK